MLRCVVHTMHKIYICIYTLVYLNHSRYLPNIRGTKNIVYFHLFNFQKNKYKIHVDSDNVHGNFLLEIN